MNTQLAIMPASHTLSNRPQAVARFELSVAGPEEREQIYRLRHEVFGRELGQHSTNAAGRLRDALDDWNCYLIAKVANQIAGFISITPPGQPSYSLDKYLTRAQLPFSFDDRLYEVRLLTVLQPHRRSDLAVLLMYAAFRWVEARGGRLIMAMGRREVLDIYLRAGLESANITIRSGAVTYEVVHATVAKLRDCLQARAGLIDRLKSRTEWRLNFPFEKPAACYHGGAFFDAIGPGFNTLERQRDIINADVLDAWFPPSPNVLAALEADLPWLLRTSPPTACEGLVETIARVRGVEPDNILPGAGSSDLIFRALRHWLSPASHTLVLDPTYGEYVHVLEQVIGCTVDRLLLLRRDGYAVDVPRLEAALAGGYDCVVLVNPNSPTGRHIPREVLERVLRRVPPGTRIWVDETYVEYAGAGESLERFAARSENVIVCKSMSKVYALSGARVAYICAGPHQLEGLRAITPPWVVSLPAQLAAVRALQDPGYYAARYRETAELRRQLEELLRPLGIDVVPGVANFILCHVPVAGPDAATVVRRCREQGLFLRDASVMGTQLGSHALRIAVKDAQTNQRMADVLAEALRA